MNTKIIFEAMKEFGYKEKEYSFDEWIEENGYAGELYVCFEEFCNTEMLDKPYIRSLVDNNKDLMECAEDFWNTYDEDYSWLLETLKTYHDDFIEKHKNMPEPKYKKGDVVSFSLNDKIIEGMIWVIDRYGTFEQNEEPSYDIYRFQDNTLYKHVRESLTKDLLRHGDVKEIDNNIAKNNL